MSLRERYFFGISQLKLSIKPRFFANLLHRNFFNFLHHPSQKKKTSRNLPRIFRAVSVGPTKRSSAKRCWRSRRLSACRPPRQRRRTAVVPIVVSTSCRSPPSRPTVVPIALPAFYRFAVLPTTVSARRPYSCPSTTSPPPNVCNFSTASIRRPFVAVQFCREKNLPSNPVFK